MLVAAPIVFVATAEPSAAPPNVVLVIADDQGYGDIGRHGNAMVRTPHLDRLHDESVRFTRFHVDPTCSPTRAALLTGRYSTRTGVWHTVMGRSLLYRDETTLADVFKANGYRTGIVGKWHLGDTYPLRPQDRGFEHAITHGGGGIGQTPDFWGNDYFDDHYDVNGVWQPFSGYCTDVFFDEARRFIDANQGQPFFLYLATNVPHSPHRVPERYQRHYLENGVPREMAAFYGMIENLDKNIGGLRAHLRERGLEENTLFIYMTDNGSTFGARPVPADEPQATWTRFNAEMRGTKGTEYDGGHRVPFFLRWPARGLGGGANGSRAIPQLTGHLDVLPTLIELCGLRFDPPHPLDGRSLVPLLEGRADDWPERTLFVHVQRDELPPKWRRSAVMTERWRYVNGAELYDVSVDPRQTRNVASEHPEAVAALRAAYERWWESLQPSLARYEPIVIGAPGHPITRINCMDWHAPLAQIPWDQPQIEKMPAANGWWMIEAAEAGRYRFILRHQPAQAAFPLRAVRARVRVGDEEAVIAVAPGATEVTIDLELPVGPARLQTWLEEADGTVRGAFFVDVQQER